MGDLNLEHIFCCKCLNVLPDHVIFPCGHYVCRKCDGITNCLTCGLPVCLIKDSFSLQCYRKMVSEGLLTPSSKSILPKGQVSNKKKPAKSPGVQKAGSTAQKQKKTRKNSTSADDVTAWTPRATRNSPRGSCKKLVHESDSCPEKSEASSVSETPTTKTSRKSSTEQVVESDKSGGTSVNATPKDDKEPHVHAKKARLLKNCLSASKPRLSAAEKVEPKLDDIVRAGCPPLKKRKTASVPRVAITRLSLKTAKRHIDSSEEDDGVFIDTDSIVGCGKTLEVVAQVHADPCFSSATSLDNSQTDEKPIGYTQIGLGHLDRDEEQDDAGTSSLMTPEKSLTEENAIKCSQAVSSHSKQHVMFSSGGSVSSQDFVGFEDGTNTTNKQTCVESKTETPIDGKNSIHGNDDNTVEMEVVECPGDESIIKSSVPPVDETLHVQILKTRKVRKRKSSKRSRRKSNNAIRDQDSDNNLQTHEGPSEDMLQENEKDLPVSFLCDDPSNFTVKTPKHSHTLFEDEVPDKFSSAKKRFPKYLGDRDQIYTVTKGSSSESLHPQHDVRPSEGILLQENGKDLPVRSPCDDPSNFTVKTPKHSHTLFEDAVDRFSFAEKRFPKYLEDRDKISTATNGSSSESLHPQHDVRPSESILLQESEKDLPVSSPCDDPSNFTVKTPKHSHTLFEDAVPDRFSFAEKRFPKYLEDWDTMYNASKGSSSESLHPQHDVRPSEGILLQENEKDLPVSVPCDGPSNFTVKIPKHEDEVPDRFSFLDKRFPKYPEDRDKIYTSTKGSTSESLHPQHDVRPSEGILLQESEKDLPVSVPYDDPSDFTAKTPEHAHTLFEDAVPDRFSFAEKRFPKYLEDCDKISTATNGSSSESLHAQHDVRPSEGIQENEKDLPVSSPCGDTSNFILKTPKHSLSLIEDKVPGCFSFAEKYTSKCLEDRDKISTTAVVYSSESLHPQPDERPSENILLQGNENGSCDVPSDFVLKTPKHTNVVFEADSFSFAGKISSSSHQDRDKLDAVTNLSSPGSLYQPKVSAIITPPTSTSGKTLATVQTSSESQSRLPYQQGSSADSLLDIPSNLSSQTSVMDLPEIRLHTHKLLKNVFSKIYLSERPKSLIRLAFDVLLLPLKNEDVFHGLSAISPVTASAEKSVQVDLFLEQTTVKVDLGKDPVKRNSFTRRQLSFVAGEPSPSKKSEFSDLEPEESEDIVEGTPTKDQLVRVNLLSDSTCSPLSRTSVHEDSPAQICVQATVNEVPAFSIFDPLPRSMDASQAKLAQSQSTGHSAHPSSPMKSSHPKTSPSEQSFKEATAAPQIDNYNLSRPPSSTPKSQPMDSSLAYTDSESIIGDSEQLPHQRKHCPALPLRGNCNQTPKEDNEEGIISPRPFRNISNLFQVTTTGIYDNVEKKSIRKLCDLIKATFSTELTKDTTHLILPDGEDVTVTTKFLMALYNGSYILPMRWVFDCLISKSIQPEADYFFKHPGIHRRMMMPRRAALFENYAFYISPEIRKDGVNYKALKDLMRFCNCNITETLEGIFRVASRYKAVVLRGEDYLPSQNIKGRHDVIQVQYQWFYSCLTSYEIQPFDKHNYN